MMTAFFEKLPHFPLEKCTEPEDKKAMKNSGKQKHTDGPVRTARVDNLLRPEMLDAFDRKAFEQDGYWVWEGILTDAGREQFAASLQKLQHMNNGILMDTDWAAIDFEGRGLAPPAARTNHPRVFGILLWRIGTDAQLSQIRDTPIHARPWALWSGSSVSHTRIRVARGYAGIFPSWIR